MERTIQANKRRLGAAEWFSDIDNLQDILRQIIEDVRVAKNSDTEFFPFQLHFGRAPNAELSIAAERLSSRIRSDNYRLKRDLLTAEQRQQQCDSRPRGKVVRMGQFKALENVARSANQWLTHMKTISHGEELRTLKTLTERNEILAATLRSNLSGGTIRFRSWISPE